MTSFPPSPPVNPGQIDFEPEPPSWPKVIGIISIVWGSLGVFCNACGLVSVLTLDNWIGFMPPPQQEQMKLQMQAATGLQQMAVQVVSVLVAAMLIFAGVQLLQRKPIGRALHLAYAIVGIILAVAAGITTYQSTQAQIQSLSASPNTAKMAGMMKASMYIGTVVGVVIRLVYPGFLLVWFGLIKKNAQDITQGVRQDFI